MKYIKVYETFKFHTNELYDETTLDFVDKYYSDETGESYYGDYSEILNRVNGFSLSPTSHKDLTIYQGNRDEHPDEFEIVLKNDINLKIIDIQEIDNSVYL